MAMRVNAYYVSFRFFFFTSIFLKKVGKVVLSSLS